jgi:hypothetical protein
VPYSFLQLRSSWCHIPSFCSSLPSNSSLILILLFLIPHSLLFWPLKGQFLLSTVTDPYLLFPIKI